MMVLSQMTKCNKKYVTFAFILMLFFSMQASGLVLHPNNEPPTSWSGRPSSNVVGRWGSNSSCVVISADCVATTNHQGGGVGTAVVIDGQTYYVARVERDGATDVRVAKLRLAELSEFVPLYTGSGELLRSFVLGGYGKGRGTELITSGTVYGYTWSLTPNTTLRWGTNIIDSIHPSDSKIIIADFDAPGRRATDYETIIAEYDSGGGWFVEDSSQWKLMGLTYSVSSHQGAPAQCWFKDPVTLQNAPDYIFAHRVSSYASWIATTASRLADCGNEPQDITEDCMVNIEDVKALAKYWASVPSSNAARERADIDNDNVVNMLDFIEIAKNWNENYW